MGWGVLGGIVGAATSLWESQRARKDAKKQFQATTLTARVNEAKRLGISPLAVLGSPTASPTIMGGGQSDTGSHLKDAAQAMRKPPPKAKLSALDYRIKAQQLKNLEAEELLTLSQAARDSQPGRNLPPTPESYGQPGSQILTGPKGGKFRTSPSSQQQDVEDQYGGVVGEGYGMYRAWQDKRQNDRRKPQPYRKGTPRGTMPKGYPKQKKYTTGGGF